MEGEISALFDKYKCVLCGIHIYTCTACEENFFVRKYHFCYFDRSLLLAELYSPDEGFDEECQELLFDCSCRLPCAHHHLIKA